jgi:hypothetical protein
VEEPRGIHAYKLAVGFVPQEDTMLREMTPKEILRFAARMRLPPGTPEAEVQRAVVGTLDRLNLWAIRHTQVAGSPGRHRRSTRSWTAIDCHSFEIHTVMLRSLLPCLVRMTASPSPGAGR